MKLWPQMFRIVRVNQALIGMNPKLLVFCPSERRRFVVKLCVCVLCAALLQEG